MTKTCIALAALLSLLSPAFGCATASDKGPIPELSAGKADGDLEVIEHDDFAFGAELGAELSPGTAHAWKVSVSGEAQLRFETSATDSLDTLIYVADAEGAELAVDDDGGEGYLSALEIAVDAGEYVVTVAGYDNAASGAFGLSATCAGAGCPDGSTEPTEPSEPSDDPWALAKDVNRMNVPFTEATPIPESFSRPEGISPVSLSGPEWWQRWSGGATQSFSWSEGTDYGKRCGQASAIRLTAIWEYEETDAEGNVSQPGRDAFQALLDGSGWRGTMYNWTEDVSEGGRASFSPATMWAWRTGAVKFINVVRPDGSCDLPTLDLVQRFSANCLEQAARSDGEIQGCSAEGR